MSSLNGGLPRRDPALEAALNTYARDGLKPIALVLIMLFTFSGLWRLNVVRTVDAIVLGEFLSALAALAVLLVAARFNRDGSHSTVLLSLVAGIATANSLLQLFHSHAGWDTTNLALIIGATSLVSISAVGSAIIYGAIWSGWLTCALMYPNGEWFHYGLFLLWTTAIAVVAQAVRMTLLRRMIHAQASARAALEELVHERTRQLDESLDRLRHAERLAALGTLTAGVAHEIRNPVGLILLTAEQLLLEKTVREPVENHRLADIIEQCRRCGRMISSVLGFARRDPAARTNLNVNTAIASAISLTRTFAAEHAGEIETRLAENLPEIQGQPIALEQVFVNLICNGIQSVSDRSPCISITSEETADGVRVVVIDNGPGIAEEDLPHIFAPYFSRRTDGTGLGLTIVKQIVAEHGGQVRALPDPGGGAALVVDLPVRVPLSV